ncbi:MAG: M23 family metallopeptidase [Nitrospirae bacterium]|nr:M23 family metallopeptidase [Nitrospirota bacterium]MBF0533839.1 M23 family metallopeptidase [Nitrospirota bacterium]MBF0615452.1 M23 family metallopeptidase [Nitrospirota bacterium]
MFRNEKSSGLIRFTYYGLGIVIAALVIFLLYTLISSKPPVISGLDGLAKLPRKKDVPIKIDCKSTIKSVSITISQGDNTKAQEILSDNPGKKTADYLLKIEPVKLSLKDGTAQIKVIIKSGLFTKTEKMFETVIDTIPPIIAVLDSTYISDQGSATAVLIEASGADSVYVKIGDKTYPAVNSIFKNKNHYFCIYPLDVDYNGTVPLTAVAEDNAGNMVMTPIKTIFKPTVYRKDIIKISDDFIKRQVYPLLGITEGEMPPVDAFIKLNEGWRKDNEAKIQEISAKSVSEILWQGAFIQMKNTKVFAHFGDIRSYEYGGKIISGSRHMGYDLASLANSPVPAANSGIVQFAGNLGIYGNAIIIDHGLGLMSLYGHLSAIMVKEGDKVVKGGIIAKSGMTGFAGGDHLHFAIICHGVYVSPVQWWDKLWIDKRISLVLNKG